MKFVELKLPGAFLIEPEPHRDNRGHFGRIWCREEFGALGLDTTIAQTNFGFSRSKGTLRGLHYQRPPHAEVKVLRCTRGSVFDVIVDLRPESPTFGEWEGVELSEENSRMIYVPEGFGQGYLTLSDDAEIYYHTSRPYAPASATGVRFDDPALGIVWPAEIVVISDQDRAWPDLDLERSPMETTA